MNVTGMGHQLLMLALVAGSGLGGSAVQAQSPPEPAASQPAPAEAAPSPVASAVATMSSNLRGDQGGDPQKALKGDPTGNFSFHTEVGPNEWWMVDLKKGIVLDSLKIYNRFEYAERATSLEVFIAPEGPAPSSRDDWRRIYSNNGKAFKGVNPDAPANDLAGADGPLVVPALGMKARYIKIQLAKRDYLHLDKVVIKEQKPGAARAVTATPETDLLGNSTDPFALK